MFCYHDFHSYLTFLTHLPFRSCTCKKGTDIDVSVLIEIVRKVRKEMGWGLKQWQTLSIFTTYKFEFHKMSPRFVWYLGAMSCYNAIFINSVLTELIEFQAHQRYNSCPKRRRAKCHYLQVTPQFWEMKVFFDQSVQLSQYWRTDCIKSNIGRSNVFMVEFVFVKFGLFIRPSSSQPSIWRWS